MGISDFGAQTILWRYQTPLVGSDLAQVNAGVLYEGIYSGLVASLSAGATISVTPGNCLIYDHASYGTAAAKLVRVVFGTSFTFDCNTVTKPRYVVLRFTWVDALENYADIINTDTVEPYDLVLCSLEWNGTVLSSVDAGSASKGFRENFDTVINNLRPSVNFNETLAVAIAAGRYVYGKTSIDFAGGFVSLGLSSVSGGRYDIVGLNAAGSLVVSKGVDGSGFPPVLGDYLPLCQVYVRQNATLLRMVDIKDIRPYLTFSGVLPANAVTMTVPTEGSLPGTFTYLQDFIDWFDDAAWTTPTFNAAALEGSVKEVILTAGSDAKIPTSKAVADYVADVASGLNTNIRNDAVKTADPGYIDLVNKMNFYLARDVGQIAWYPFAPGNGWLRADGLVIDKSLEPLYATLVDKLKAVAGLDSAHPFFDFDPNKAKLPDLRGRYIKDVGDSGRKIGNLLAGALVEHTHTVTIANSASDRHSHSMAHTHGFSASTLDGGGIASLTVTVASHFHSMSLAHQHELCNLNHKHKLWGRKGTNGSNWPRMTAGKDHYNQTGLEAGELEWSVPDRKLTVTTENDGGGALDNRDTGGKGGTGTAVIPTHTHPLPTTLQPSTGVTGEANPPTHTHAGAAVVAGTALENDVNNVALMAYIFYGYHPA